MQYWQWGRSELREMLPVRELLSMLAGLLDPSFVEDLFDGEPLKQSKLKAAKILHRTSIPLPIMAIQIRVLFVKDCPHFCGCLIVTCSYLFVF